MRKIKRTLISDLHKWHQQADRKPLLIRGARQVGKSWAVSEWCKQESLQLVSVNFEEQPRFVNIFEEDLDVTRIINELTTSFGVSLRSPGTVLFLDEIQLAPKAITALRYFYEKAPEIIVVAAGSLIEFVLQEHGLPVGRVQSHFVYPLSFVEFLEALGKSGLAQAIQSFSVDAAAPFSSFIHDELLSLLKLYYQVGGMPKVVSTYIDTHDLLGVSREQAALIGGYRDDFRKYAKKSDWVLLETIFQKMGELAGSAPVKFSTIDQQTKSPQVRRALLALEHALIIHKILPTQTKKLPLAAHANDKRFKLSFLDIGLLHHLIGFDWNIVSPDFDLTDIASGRFAEQFVAQEIIAARSGSNNYSLHCWDRAQKGSEAEVDFVVEYQNTPVPIEVKSGPRGRLKSLDLYIKELHPSNAFVLSQRNVSRMGEILFLPLYVASRF